MKILVTGGCGFIGRHLVKRLLENKNNHVIVLDNFQAGQNNKFVAKEWRDYKNYSLFNIDCRNGTLPTVDLVYHLAAHIGTKNISDNPIDVMLDNISMMMNIIGEYSDTPTKIIYTSTTEVCMGRDQVRPTNEKAPTGWTCPIEPRWAYSFSKYVAEELLKNSKCNWAITRFGNVYGPQMVQDYAIKSIMKRMLSGETPLKIYSPYDTRTFCYVDDIVDGLIMMAGVDKEVVNFAGNESITIKKLYKEVVKASGKKVELETQLQTSPIEFRDIDCAKAKCLGWKPKTSFKSGLLKTWEYYESN